jgi:hypothetical protein
VRRRIALFALALGSACVGSTGSKLVTFQAYAAGPADADPTKPLVFDNGRGFHVTLTRAKVHVGGVYLNRSLPVSGSQATACALPGLYVAEVAGGLDVDALSPVPQPFPAVGDGSTDRARAGEVWLTSGDVNATDDTTVVLDLAGGAEKDGATWAFDGTITIGKNRVIAPKDAAQPGSNPICKQRIVSPIPIDVTPADHGGLLVRLDPRAWLAAVDFSSLSPEPAPSKRVTFADSPDDQASIALYTGLRAAGAGYSFSWADVASSAAPTTFDHGPPPDGTGGAGGSTGTMLPCPEGKAVPTAPAALAPFSAPGDPGPDGILVTASGEALAFGGYPFPPANDDDPAFVDGWEVTFDRVLVTLDHVTLSQTPDLSPGDPSLVGAVVATSDGPWAVDLHPKGPLAGKGGGDETAVPVTSFTGLDSQTRYAFAFETSAATPAAKNVNLDAAGLADYSEMIASGYSVLYVGTARFKGVSCSPASGPALDALPKVVPFRLGFATPTAYSNCQNPDNDPAKAFGGEEHQRGVSPRSNASVVAQMTIHTDHPFWEAVAHDAPAHFDAIAARYSGCPSPTARVEDLAGVDFFGFRDRAARPLPWRTCRPSYTPPKGTMHFDPGSVPVDPASTDGSRLRDYRDFMAYVQSTQGHLNADGLCFVRRKYASPP